MHIGSTEDAAACRPARPDDTLLHCARSSKLLSLQMAGFSTKFLGCKVSFADAQAIRERLLADGHHESGDGDADVAVINTCCVTNEALSKSRQAASRAARRARRVYVTGCAANLADAFSGLPENVVVVPRTGEEAAAAVAGDVGAIGCVQADHRLDRVRAFVKIQDGCSFSCHFCVIPVVRGGTRSRSARGRAGRDPPPDRSGASRDRAHRRQPRLLPRPGRGVHAGPARARGGSIAGCRAAATLLDRDQPRERRAGVRAA